MEKAHGTVGTVENMNWIEVMQSDDAKVALKTFLDVKPASRHY